MIPIAKKTFFIVAVIASVYLYLFAGRNAITFDPDKSFPADLNGKPKTSFYAGERIYIMRTFCINLDVPGTATRLMQNLETGVVYFLGTTMYDGRTGCRTHPYQSVVPSDIPPGEYDIHAKFTLEINPINTRVFNAPTVRVTIK